MGDREARALAAGEEIEVNGNKFLLRPVVAQNLCDLERSALKFFKRSVLETYTDNFDLLETRLGKDDATKLLERKFDEVRGWDVESLPQKTAYDVSRVPLTADLLTFLEETYDELPEADNGKKALLMHALDAERVTSKEVEKMTERRPTKGSVRYDQWWVTGSAEGMVSFIHSSLRKEHPDTTIDDIKQWPFPKLAEGARIVENITSASLKNG